MERSSPVPAQCGQVTVEPAITPARRRWRDISSRPNCEILPICTRARSFFTASRSRFSTSRSLRPLFHVNEVNHDKAGQVAQAQLAADFAGGFQVGLARGFLDGVFAGGAAGVHVNRDQGFGLVDDEYSRPTSA